MSKRKNSEQFLESRKSNGRQNATQCSIGSGVLVVDNQDDAASTTHVTTREEETCGEYWCFKGMHTNLSEYAQKALAVNAPDNMDDLLYLPRWGGLKNYVNVKVKCFLLVMHLLVTVQNRLNPNKRITEGGVYTWAFDNKPIGWKYMCDEEYLTDRRVTMYYDSMLADLEGMLSSNICDTVV